MTALDNFPEVDSFFGIDLRTGSMIIAALGIVHPMAYGCTLFMPMSYLFVTVWILVALYLAASIVLFSGLANNDASLCGIWVWYAVVFVGIMLMLMMLLAVVYTSRKQRARVIAAIFGILYYLLTIYFIAVVNSHRKKLVASSTQSVTDAEVTTAPSISHQFIADQQEDTTPDIERTGIVLAKTLKKLNEIVLSTNKTI